MILTTNPVISNPNITMIKETIDSMRSINPLLEKINLYILCDSYLIDEEYFKKFEWNKMGKLIKKRAKLYELYIENPEKEYENNPYTHHKINC